jgi:signal peptidase
MKRLFSIAQGLVTGVALLFILVVASSFLPIPGAVKIFTVRSGSMEPAVHTGSLILVWPAAEYSVGDIITIRSDEDKKTITHRVIEMKKSETGDVFVTKGDANEERDQEEIRSSAIIGKMFLSIPYFGYPVAYAQTKQGFLSLVVIPAALVILGESVTIFQEMRSMVRRRRKPEVPEPSVVENVRFMDSRPIVPPVARPESPPPSVPIRKRRIV